MRQVKSNAKDKDKESSNAEKYQNYIPCSLTYKVVYIDDKFSKPAVLYRGKNAVNKFIEVIFKEAN